MLRLSVIKSCFVFPDGVSLPLGWDEATVLWSLGLSLLSPSFGWGWWRALGGISPAGRRQRTQNAYRAGSNPASPTS